MSELNKYLEEKGIDTIEDDEKFMREEYEAVREYCERKSFYLSAEDRRTINERGLGEYVAIWKESWEEWNR